jgi:hypothetical protein
MEKFGWGSEDLYEKIRLELKKSPLFRFDWFIKSRNTTVYKKLILGNYAPLQYPAITSSERNGRGNAEKAKRWRSY